MRGTHVIYLQGAGFAEFSKFGATDWVHFTPNLIDASEIHTRKDLEYALDAIARTLDGREFPHPVKDRKITLLEKKMYQQV